MAASALILFSLVNNNSANQMSHLFDLNNLKAQDKNKLLEIKKQQYLNKRNQKSKCKEMMYNNKSNKSKYYNHSNFNITKEYKR
jgi:hypothetical protein